MCHPAWGRALTAAHQLNDLARLRRVRDRIDRERARPLDVEALARDVGMSAGDLVHRFELAYGRSPHAYLMARLTGAGSVSGVNRAPSRATRSGTIR